MDHTNYFGQPSMGKYQFVIIVISLGIGSINKVFFFFVLSKNILVTRLGT